MGVSPGSGAADGRTVAAAWKGFRPDREERIGAPLQEAAQVGWAKNKCCLLGGFRYHIKQFFYTPSGEENTSNLRTDFLLVLIDLFFPIGVTWL